MRARDLIVLDPAEFFSHIYRINHVSTKLDT